MSLGNGEYLIISSCLKCPYEFKSISLLMQEISSCYNIKINEATFLEIKPQEATYDTIWNGEIKECNSKEFSIDKLEKYFLSSLDIEFDESTVARLQVNFVDYICYEVSMIFNYTQLIEEENKIENKVKNAIFVEGIGLHIFKRLAPILGKICIESSMSSISSIIDREESLPIDRAFYSKYFFDKQPELFNILVNSDCFIKEIEDIGIYFRKGKEEDFIIKKMDSIMYEEIFSRVVVVLKELFEDVF